MVLILQIAAGIVLGFVLLKFFPLIIEMSILLIPILLLIVGAVAFLSQIGTEGVITIIITVTIITGLGSILKKWEPAKKDKRYADADSKIAKPPNKVITAIFQIVFNLSIFITFIFFSLPYSLVWSLILVFPIALIFYSFQLLGLTDDYNSPLLMKIRIAITIIISVFAGASTLWNKEKKEKRVEKK